MSNHQQDSTQCKLSFSPQQRITSLFRHLDFDDAKAATGLHVAVESSRTPTASTSSMALCKARPFMQTSCAVHCATDSTNGHEPSCPIRSASCRAYSLTSRSCIVLFSHLNRTKAFTFICSAGPTKTSAGLSRDRLRCRNGPIAPVHLMPPRGERLSSSKGCWSRAC